MWSSLFTRVVALALWCLTSAAPEKKTFFLNSQPVKIGHWNVYWRALNNPAGQQAIKVGIDAAVKEDGPFDFFAMIEAGGSAHISHFPAWVQSSETLKDGGPMKYLHGKSAHEDIALFYQHELWEPIWSEVNDFENGRPFLTALFKPRPANNETGENGFGSCTDAVWIVAAHLPHFSWRYRKADGPKTGDKFRDILAKGAMITGCEASAMPTIIVGDFNEFGECSVPPHVQCRQAGFHQAARSLQPLWDYFGEGGMTDAADSESATCCTKWHEHVYNDWHHHYDHIYYTNGFLNISKAASFIPYMYPGATCDGVSCTGPLKGAPPRSQGSWHRGWQATFSPRPLPESLVV